MTDQQKQQLRQQAANFRSAVLAIMPTAKSANLSLNLDGDQVSMNIQSADTSVQSGTAVEVYSTACKSADLPPAA